MLPLRGTVRLRGLFRDRRIASVNSAADILPALEIKGATVPAVRLLVQSLDPQWLRAELERVLGKAGDFFEAELAVLDLASVEDDSVTPDWRRLGDVLSMRGLVLAAVANASGPVADSARAAALALVSVPKVAVRQAVEPTPAAPPPPASEKPPTPDEVIQAPTLIIDRPVRSGQQIYGQGCDVVLLQMANTGSEVIADGSIHVYAPLRGRALAGARGDTAARIFTTSFEAELVSIAGVYRTFEDGIPAALAHCATQVRLVVTESGEQSLLIQALNIR